VAPGFVEIIRGFLEYWGMNVEMLVKSLIKMIFLVQSIFYRLQIRLVFPIIPNVGEDQQIVVPENSRMPFQGIGFFTKIILEKICPLFYLSGIGAKNFRCLR
jgi:hypothetical protein